MSGQRERQRKKFGNPTALHCTPTTHRTVVSSVPEQVYEQSTCQQCADEPLRAKTKLRNARRQPPRTQNLKFRKKSEDLGFAPQVIYKTTDGPYESYSQRISVINYQRIEAFIRGTITHPIERVPFGFPSGFRRLSSFLVAFPWVCMDSVRSRETSSEWVAAT